MEQLVTRVGSHKFESLSGHVVLSLLAILKNTIYLLFLYA